MNTYQSSSPDRDPRDIKRGDLEGGLQSGGAPRTVSRRQLLQILGLGGIAGATGILGACSSESEAASGANGKKTPAKRVNGKKADQKSNQKANQKSAAKENDRVLVLLELGGGHDGFAMNVPYADATFRRLRDRIWIDPKELHPIDDKYALAKGLAPVAGRLAFVEGVGVAKPNLSHFDMLQRWWAGDADGSQGLTTGFLGRCCDVLQVDQPLSGVSLGGGATPTLITSKATTVSLPALDAVRELVKDEPDNRRLRDALRDITTTKPGPSGIGTSETTDRLMAMARSGLGASLDLSAMVGRIGEQPKGYPDSDIARPLAMARQLISLNAGIRIIHVPWGSFDTHSNQQGGHSGQMDSLGAALDAFAKDLEKSGLSDRVLLATASEFGRRIEANQSGTDHGTASTMMLMGPLKTGRHGVAPNFKALDAEGNVKATTSMTDYYATLASWLGIRPSDVLEKSATPIDTLRL